MLIYLDILPEGYESCDIIVRPLPIIFRKRLRRSVDILESLELAKATPVM